IPKGALIHLQAKLAAIDCPKNPTLEVKVPEGFAFYALFPEQYCASFVKWIADHCSACPKRAVVAGIRSIGTTLSALGSAALTALGWEAGRITIRPTGHPFQRRVEMKPADLSRTSSALIVDEGPGLSGSSMVAVA